MAVRPSYRFYRTSRQRHGWYTQWASTCVYVSVLWMVWLYDVQACELCKTRDLDCWTSTYFALTWHQPASSQQATVPKDNMKTCHLVFHSNLDTSQL